MNEESPSPESLWALADMVEARVLRETMGQCSECFDAVNLIGEALTLLPMLPMPEQLSIQHFAAMLPITRALGELRSMRHLLTFGYLLQAGSLAASYWEYLVTAQAIRSSKTRARTYLKADTGRAKWPIRQQCVWAMGSEESASIQYTHYGFLCELKHVSGQSLMHVSAVTRLDGINSVVMPMPTLPAQGTEIRGGIVIITFLITEPLFKRCLEDCTDKTGDCYLKFKGLIERAMVVSVAAAQPFLERDPTVCAFERDLGFRHKARKEK